jgi:mannose-6-phosphate isomerase-like protein (cupin superfamily)
MRIERANTSLEKGWYLGPWNSTLPVSVGYANTGVDEPHLHAQVVELYLIARGTATIRIEQETITLSAGDLLMVEAGEAHTFLGSSPDYFHFVIHIPGLAGEAARAEKTLVSRSRLGLAEL